MKENVKYLSDWLEKVTDLAKSIQTQAKKENKPKSAPNKPNRGPQGDAQ